MKRTLLIVMLITSLSLSACFALQEPEASSGDVAAPTIALATQETQPTPTQPPATESPAPAETELEPAAAQAEDTQPVSESSPSGASIFEIQPGSSQARFTIDEVLRGADKTVVGTGSNVAGQIAVDLSAPSTAQIGEILINARDFTTDNNFRNRAIANEILLTNQHEFITITPKQISGLPDSVAIGETYTLQVLADLTMIGQTNEVSFEVTVTPESETQLTGLASTTIQYADWGISVPLSQSVQAVADEVLLELEFSAVKI